MECVTCKNITKKYKCPTCLGYYCSLDCYKTHKGTNECVTPNLPPDTTQGAEYEKIPIPFKTEDTVRLEKLEALRHSDALKNLLYNPHLRALLKEIDEAPVAWKAMKVAMQEPLFLEFADECLKVVEPQNLT